MEQNEIQLRKLLPIDDSFDVIERKISIGGKDASLYFIDGFIKDEVMQRILTDFFKIKAEEWEALPTLFDFSKEKIPYVEVVVEDDAEKAANGVLSGQTVLYLQGYASYILMDLRTYPTRSVGEPAKEKTLRGARDGFVETIVFNTALIRRRIRDKRMVFSMKSIGSISKTDVCIGYLKGLVDEEILKTLTERLSQLDIETLNMGDQSLIEVLKGGSVWNPFPKVRYTERPDVAAAHLAEGKIILLVDNTPTAMILPTGIFDFFQDVDDYYFPVLTGNYFRFIRNLTGLSTLFLTPLYLLFVDHLSQFHNGSFNFLLPQEAYSIPLFCQFLLLEIAVDGLKMASLNTPDSLGMSLSVIGALILGEFSVSSGWLIPQAILLMAVVALAGFSQPSIELSFAVKFMRILLLFSISFFGIWGLLGGLFFELILLAATKTVTGTSYLYPLFPFNGKKLKDLLFRTKKKQK